MGHAAAARAYTQSRLYVREDLSAAHVSSLVGESELSRRPLQAHLASGFSEPAYEAVRLRDRKQMIATYGARSNWMLVLGRERSHCWIAFRMCNNLIGVGVVGASFCVMLWPDSMQ